MYRVFLTSCIGWFKYVDLIFGIIMSEELPQIGSQSMETEQLYDDHVRNKSEMKPKVSGSRKERIRSFIEKLNNDNIQNGLDDILEENKQLQRELETCRKNLTGAKKAYEDLIHAINEDRLKQQIDSIHSYNFGSN